MKRFLGRTCSVAAFAIAVLVSSTLAKARPWADIYGHKSNGTFVRVHQGNVIIKVGARVISVPYEDLVDDDQQYVYDQLKAKGKEDAVPAPGASRKKREELERAKLNQNKGGGATGQGGIFSGFPGFMPGTGTGTNSSTPANGSNPTNSPYPNSGTAGNPYPNSGTASNPYPTAGSTPSTSNSNPYPTAGSASSTSSPYPNMASAPPSSNSTTGTNPYPSSPYPNSGNTTSSSVTSSNPAIGSSASSSPPSPAFPRSPSLAPPTPSFPFSSGPSPEGIPMWECSNCKKPLADGTPGKKCPHCGVYLEYTEMADGRWKDSKGEIHSGPFPGKTVFGGVAGVVITVIFVLIRLMVRNR